MKLWGLCELDRDPIARFIWARKSFPGDLQGRCRRRLRDMGKLGGTGQKVQSKSELRRT